MSMEYIRKTYNVPAKRGGKIKWLYHSFTDGFTTVLLMALLLAPRGHASVLSWQQKRGQNFFIRRG